MNSRHVQTSYCYGHTRQAWSAYSPVDNTSWAALFELPSLLGPFAESADVPWAMVEFHTGCSLRLPSYAVPCSGANLMWRCWMPSGLHILALLRVYLLFLLDIVLREHGTNVEVKEIDVGAGAEQEEKDTGANVDAVRSVGPL